MNLTNYLTRFTSHGVEYELDHHGIINQLNPQPFVYDEQYVACYDGPEYQKLSDLLMGIRLAFVTGALGREPRSLLDYGFGNGAFLKFAKERLAVGGIDVTGKKLEGIPTYMDLGMLPSQPEVITFWDVLEHLPSLTFLRDLRCRLIVVSLPWCHYVTQGKPWFDEQYRHRKPNEHVRHFTPYSLRSVMEELGWEQTAVSTQEDQVRKSTYALGLPNILSMAFIRGRRG